LNLLGYTYRAGQGWRPRVYHRHAIIDIAAAGVLGVLHWWGNDADAMAAPR
jgi:hypothetical protein